MSAIVTLAVLKFCKDCKHIRNVDPESRTPYEYARCSFNAPLNLVSGKLDMPYCSSARADTLGHCKAEAIHFEAPLPVCDDCEEATDWPHVVQHDPWGKPTGEVFCENCAEKRWDRQQERAMEET